MAVAPIQQTTTTSPKTILLTKKWTKQKKNWDILFL
jgi:hypothetical protein